jgi:DNA repair exonuclease SbcCD ATPase subunit/DNA repair exonuclease SbcCD nuclease subunit
MINKIKSNIQAVDHIFHIADIHLRNWKRHKEFKEVFDKMFAELDQCPPNTIVTVGGDIVHAKTDMSPELISMVTYLFNGLADRRPTIVITGNHDANLNNNHRLDALTPIVESNNHPNLFYLRNSGLYEIGDIAVSVMSLLDEPEKYVTYDKIKNPDQYKKLVALYHGTIANSQVDSGLTLEHGLNWDVFAGFDVVPLGDIHKRQILSKQQPAIFYPGSLVQQNFGEVYEGHGYAFITLTDDREIEYTFHDIQNDYGYYTLDINDGELPDNLPITAKTNLRIRTRNTDPAQLKRILATIRKEYKNKDAVVVKLDKSGTGAGSDLTDASLEQGDVRNIQYQNALLSEWMTNAGTDDETRAKVIEINKKLNAELQLPDIARNVVWKPKKFTFSNMFSYGEGNVIDFGTKMGTCGLFAPNHAGKSAVLDALCFCLFDQSFRAKSADQVLNRRCEDFECEFNFELEGVNYFIQKRAFKYKHGALKGRLRVEIDFWYINEDGEKVSLNGEQRRDTDKIIQSYVGTFDDFILTALSLQQNNSNFIDKTQSERKDLLANFLDVTIFDSLYELANKNNRKAAVALEEYQKQDFETKLGDAERSKELYEDKLETTTVELESVNKEIQDINDKLLELNKELQPCKGEGLNLEELEASLVDSENLLVEWEEKYTTSQQTYKEFERDHSAKCYEIEQKKKSFDVNLHNDYQSEVAAKVMLDKELDTLKLTTKNKLEKLAKLNEHEYDPNCQYCVSNVFVQDAMKTKKELEEDKQTVAEFLQKRKDCVDFIEQNSFIQEQADELNKLLEERAQLDLKRTTASVGLERARSSRDKLKTQIKEIQADIKVYYESIAILDNNKTIQDEISKLNKEKNVKAVTQSKLNNTVKDYHGKVQVAIQTISDCNRTIARMKELLEEQDAYDVYCKAMYKDGIPYQLISKAVPYIQHHTNLTLNQITDFEVRLETDGKNINAFITYDDDKWPLELSSGMERFLSSIAIRIALIKITNLPKPDFLAIDEGLGVLDSSNLNSMHTLFTNMKDTFRFSLVISHIDVVRDMVDNILTIDRKDDFSYINC